MRKVRDYDAELKALGDKARALKAKRVEQLGQLVAATGADALDAETCSRDRNLRHLCTKTAPAFNTGNTEAMTGRQCPSPSGQIGHFVQHGP